MQKKTSCMRTESLVGETYLQFVNDFFSSDLDDDSLRAKYSSIGINLPKELHNALQPIELKDSSCIYCGTSLYISPKPRFDKEWINSNNYYCPICGHRSITKNVFSDEFCSCKYCSKKKSFLSRLETLKSQGKSLGEINELTFCYNKWRSVFKIEHKPIVDLPFNLLFELYTLDHIFNIYGNNLISIDNGIEKHSLFLDPLTNVFLDSLIDNGLLSKCSYRKLTSPRYRQKQVGSKKLACMYKLNLSEKERKEVMIAISSVWTKFDIPEILSLWHMLLLEEFSIFVKYKCEEFNIKNIKLKPSIKRELIVIFNEVSLYDLKSLVIKTLKQFLNDINQNSTSIVFWDLFYKNLVSFKVNRSAILENASFISKGDISGILSINSTFLACFEDVVLNCNYPKDYLHCLEPASLNKLKRIKDNLNCN